ncbi:MAG TPA: terminase family protein [Armatimonadota bacterium]|nr:terminase family protein [Armatimonadota bacterium]
MHDLADVIRDSARRKEMRQDLAREAGRRGDIWGVFAALGYRPHDRQRAFHEARERADRRVFLAGRRSGKTRACGMEAAAGVLADDGRVLIAAPELELAERVFRVVRDSLVRDLGFVPERMHDTTQRRELVMPWGSRLVCRSGENEDAMLGDGYSLAVIDEAARMPTSTWPQVIEPALADTEGHAVFATSPAGFGWVHDLWAWCADPNRPEWVGVRATTADNPTISRTWLERIQRTVSPQVWRREYLAEFVSVEGVVYPEWAEDRHVSREAYLRPEEPIYLAMDFGTTETSPFVCLVAQKRGTAVLCVVDELVVSGLSSAECAARLAQWWRAKGFPLGAVRIAVGDVAARDARLTVERLLRGHGILAGPIQCRQQSIDAGIELIRQLLREDRLLVGPHCSFTREEFSAYAWRTPPREGEPSPGTRKTHDHAMDALRYLVFWLQGSVGHSLASAREYLLREKTQEMLAHLNRIHGPALGLAERMERVGEARTKAERVLRLTGKLTGEGVNQ